MIEELIELLRKIEGEAKGLLADLHHLRAFVANNDDLSRDYILEVLDRIIFQVE